MPIILALAAVVAAVLLYNYWRTRKEPLVNLTISPLTPPLPS